MLTEKNISDKYKYCEFCGRTLPKHYEEELKETEPFLKTLNSELTEIITYTLPIENSKRTILKITKQKTTPSIYPRNYSQIKKSLNKKQ